MKLTKKKPPDTSRLEIHYHTITELNAAEYNPRELTEKDYADIKESLSEFGFVDPVVLNMHPKRLRVVIGGHQRIRIWKDMGHTEAPCVYQYIEDIEREKQLNVRLNKNTGRWDYDKLANNFDTDNLLQWGFDASEFGLGDAGFGGGDESGGDYDKPPDSDIKMVQLVFNEDQHARFMTAMPSVRIQDENITLAVLRVVENAANNGNANTD